MFWLLLIAIFLVLLIVVFSSVPWAERKCLFYPSKKNHWKPDIPYHDVYIDIKDPKNVYHRPKGDNYIHGWHFDNFPGNKTVLYCHGNSGNISHRSYIANICQKFELNLFLFDYRGFGKSSGTPSKYRLRKDGEAAYKYITDYCGIKYKDIIIWGESLGGNVAIWTASKFKCRSLILLCTFSGLDDAIKYTFDGGVSKSLAHGFATMASMRYDIMPNRKYIRRVRCPVVIMHSKTDDIIPYDCAKILYKNIRHKSKELITIKGKHSSPDISREQFRKIFQFCDIDMSLYENKHNIDEILKDIRTVAKRYHNFID
uniref:Fermentation-respiration switch protein n=1 Tax=Pithovirus LCPAC302 TaxID=2506593 RepID=A0A481Z6I5_9VIRU|nr:MAG: fermentation-respiration switch protein [Pithovirus LCPAC302]